MLPPPPGTRGGGTFAVVSQERRVVHYASRMAVVTLVCRITGYLRDKALFSVIGAGHLYDMYRTANRIPNAFRGLFAEGTLHAAFVPTLSQLTGKDGDRREALELFRGLLAVLLLVDLSRSTANTVPGSDATVLEVEKEAIVILTQALEVLGDTFAIAGFSGNGRLGVDYFRLKDFDENLDDGARSRIGAVSAQRNTRMGAAVRHAAVQLERVPASLASVASNSSSRSSSVAS